MYFPDCVENKLKLILNKLMQINAIQSFKLTIKWGKEDDLVKVDLAALNNLLGDCLDKIAPKPRKAEIRNVISELVKKKNDSAGFLSETFENTEFLTESDSITHCKDEDAYPDRVNLSEADRFEAWRYTDKISSATSASKFDKKIFKNISERRDSLKKESKRYLCEYCGKQFFQKTAWENHFIDFHKEAKLFKCEKCPASFINQSELKIYSKVHEKDLQFKTCFATFASPGILVSHALTHQHGSKQRQSGDDVAENEFEHLNEFECNDCGRSFQSKKDLKAHISHEHGGPTRPKGCPRLGIKVRPRKEFVRLVKSECENLPSNEFSCFYSHCGKVFKRSKYLRKHIRLNHVAQTNVFSCHLCPKTFYEKSKLNRHVDCHQEEKFRCCLCSKSFTREDALKRHNYLVHEKEKRFECKICRKMFSLKYNRDRHEENAHMACENGGLNCEVCGKKLRNKSTLRIHMKLHGEEKNFSCSLCGKKFIRQIHYRTHMKNHHFGVSPFQNLLDSFAADGDCG